MKQLRVIWFAGALALASSAHAQLVNGIAVIVNDSIITFQDVQSQVAQRLGSLRNQPGITTAELERQAANLEREWLDQLIKVQLVLGDFKTKGFNLPESIINEEVERNVRNAFGGDRVLFIKTLKGKGTTEEAYRAQIREEIIYHAMRSRNVSQELIISPAKIIRYYAENQDKFRVGDQVKLRLIVINRTGGVEDAAKRRLAGEILAKLNEGADFGDLAQIHSDGSARAMRGDLGWVDRNFSREEFISVAFGLEAGQRSGVIERPEAYYLVWVEGKRAAHIQPLPEVRGAIEKDLRDEEERRLENAWIERLKARAFIRYY